MLIKLKLNYQFFLFANHHELFNVKFRNLKKIRKFRIIKVFTIMNTLKTTYTQKKTLFCFIFVNLTI